MTENQSSEMLDVMLPESNQKDSFNKAAPESRGDAVPTNERGACKSSEFDLLCEGENSDSSFWFLNGALLIGQTNGKLQMSEQVR